MKELICWLWGLVFGGFCGGFFFVGCWWWQVWGFFGCLFFLKDTFIYSKLTRRHPCCNTDITHNWKPTDRVMKPDNTKCRFLSWKKATIWWTSTYQGEHKTIWNQRLMLQSEKRSQYLGQFSPQSLCPRTSACWFWKTSVSDAAATLVQQLIDQESRPTSRRNRKSASPRQNVPYG